MNEDIYSLFSKEGAVGRLLTGYSSIECADPALYAITEYLIKATRTENAFIRPCELDELIRYRRKKCCFRPGDVIYYAKRVNDPRILSGAADRCVTSVASLFCACDSFCVDIAAAGAESVSEI
ncbi:MAG: hypothetical protein J5760_03605, partial [Clostridia bacterium]|nr:hypothetical protein [Clostridia bacterium]